MPNAYTEKLKKKSTGDYIYPVTKASATYMADDDTTVEGEFQKVHGNVATIEESSTASKAYVVGDYLVFGGKLYQVTAAISSGDTLTVGTNIAVTSVGDELKELNSKTSQLTSATFAAPTGTSNGDLKYLKLGRIVVLSGNIQCTASITRAQTLFSGLPTALANNPTFTAYNSTTGAHTHVFINTDGTLKNLDAWSTGWHRIAGAYITMS